MNDFVTCLKIDRRTPVQLEVVDDFAKLEFLGTEVEMCSESLQQLIACAERALPRLGETSRRGFAQRKYVSTWIRCDPMAPPDCLHLGEALEMIWGPLVLTLDKAVLPDLIRRGHAAHAELVERLADSTDDESDMASWSPRRAG